MHSLLKLKMTWGFAYFPFLSCKWLLSFLMADAIISNQAFGRADVINYALDYVIVRQFLTSLQDIIKQGKV